MSTKRNFKSLTQPLDRAAIAAVAVLSILIAILLWSGDRTAPLVRDFSWQGQEVSSDDTGFVLTFNRPMNHETVEKNLKLSPELRGKFSWAGRRMAYTLLSPAVYGKSYQVKLENAYDRFANEAGNHTPIQPFTGTFHTPKPIFAYIGTGDRELGRLVVYDLTKKSKQVLTPENLLVSDFRIYPDRQRMLFIATEKAPVIDPLDRKLYTVSLQPKPEVKLILDSNEYQNFKFDLSPDGSTILVQRLNRLVPGQYGLWIIKDNQPPKPLENQPGGDFTFTRDSSSIAILQGAGVAILPLEPQAKPLDFLPKFGTILSFSRDGAQAAMVKYGNNYTRSLFRVTNQGVQQEIFQTNGSILSAQFDPQAENLYCLLTDVKQTKETYRELPYLAVINLKTRNLTRLLDFPNQRNLQISIAPDGQYLLFEQVRQKIPSPKDQTGNSRNKQINIQADTTEAQTLLGTAEIEIKPQLSLLPLTSIASESEAQLLPLFGIRPQWFP
ncbi:DPP IV N-terminal domain-containing protein [Pseudanabaena sp. PCC 6802]|uniref:DPP IV N-terminal domain-containing protein n=1 Tax=Pseudanabaena sp. PCC 6802 TaxID=118173 RepID=UPI00034AF733|nr:DPP IV N-terminal domain-containing protein [Pseudanabaena sp. PCC 6802]